LSLLIVDIGTTNIKAAVFCDDGSLPVLSKRKINMHIEGGTAEQNLDEIYSKFTEAVREVVSKSTSKIESMFLSSQMHGLAVLDEKGRPLTNLLTYFDTRAEKYMGPVEKEGSEIYRETGCPPIYIYPLPKILYLKDKFRGKVRFAVSAKDYILLKLTGQHILDKSTASGSQLLNTFTLKWSNTALAIAGIDEGQLPVLVDGEKVGFKIIPQIAEEMSLPRNITIYPGVSDAAAHSTGTSFLREDILSLNVGTSAAVRVVREHPVLDYEDKMRYFCYYGGLNRWLIGGAVNNGSRVLDWFIEEFLDAEKMLSKHTGINVYDIVNRLAEKSPMGANGLFFIPYLSGERFPVRNSRIRGTIYGLSYSTKKQDILKALLEGVAYTLRWIYEAMKEKGITVSTMRGGGGGLNLSVWRKIFSDIFGLKLEYVKEIDSTMLGDYVVYKLGVDGGIPEDLEARYWSRALSISPSIDRFIKYNRYYKAFLELYKQLNAFLVKYCNL